MEKTVLVIRTPMLLGKFVLFYFILVLIFLAVWTQPTPTGSFLIQQGHNFVVDRFEENLLPWITPITCTCRSTWAQSRHVILSPQSGTGTDFARPEKPSLLQSRVSAWDMRPDPVAALCNIIVNFPGYIRTFCTLFHLIALECNWRRIFSSVYVLAPFFGRVYIHTSEFPCHDPKKCHFETAIKYLHCLPATLSRGLVDYCTWRAQLLVKAESNARHLRI